MELIAAPSPNFDDRPPGTPIDILLLHYTGMPTAASRLLCSASRAIRTPK